MGQFLNIRDGGKTSESGLLRFLRRLSSNGQGVAQTGDLAVAQHSTPNQSVDIAVGEAFIAYQDYGFWVWSTDNPYNLAIAANASGNPRIDMAVAYVDLSVVSSSSNNNPGALKFMAVQGTPAGSPSAPDNTAIQAAVGAGNPFYVLAQIAVANGFTQVVTANITDKRTLFVLGSLPKFFLGIPATILSVANNQSLNPVCPQTQTFTELDAYAYTAPVGSSLTLRVYNITQARDVGSVSISAGANQGSTTSFSNASVNKGDVLRLDVTAVGASVTGGQCSIMLY